MNLPGLDPASAPVSGAPRGPVQGREDSGTASPFARMIERGAEQWSSVDGGGSAGQRRHDPGAAEAPDAGDAGWPVAALEQDKVDAIPADTAVLSADAAMPWPPQGLASLGLVALAPSDVPIGEEPETVAAAWPQLPAAPASGDATPVTAVLPAQSPAAAGVLVAAARAQPDPQPAPAAAPAALPAVESLVAASAGSDAEAPPPSFLVAPATPVQTVREAPAALAPPPTPTPNLHGDDFAEAVGARLHWLADQKIGHAQIRITPHDLGPIEVRIRLDGDRVSADFSSAQAEVRQALEASLPRLREMLGAHGFQLAHADVGQQSRQDRATARQRGDATAAGGSGEDGGPQPVLPAIPTARGLVDAYA